MRQQIQIILGSALALTLSVANPVKAQPTIIGASPSPDEIVALPPSTVSITFDRVLSSAGTTIHVTNDQGLRVDDGKTIIDAADKRLASAKLKPLTEGIYTVSYSAMVLGSSTLIFDSYTFTVDLPEPTLELVAPVNGAAYPADAPVLLTMRTQFFDFGFYENRIRIYVDDTLYGEIESLNYKLMGLEPGVHQIRTVLTQFDGQEHPGTAIVVTIAIANPDPEVTRRRQAAETAPDAGLQLSALQLLGVMMATCGLLAAGIRLGQKQT